VAIIYVSEFVSRGSGYFRILEGLVPRLDRQEPVWVLGLNYRGSFHDFNFTVVPTRADWIPHQINEMLKDKSLGINKVVVALDLPVQAQRIMPFFPPVNRRGWRYIGIFPLDGGPLSRRFALPIQFMNEAFVISKFAQQCCFDLDLDVQYLPIGIEMEHWGPTEKEQRKHNREEFEVSDKFVVLFVGDNHERKYAVGAMEMFAEFSKDKGNTELWMITRLGSLYGFDLEYYAQAWGIENKVKFWNRTLPCEMLWTMYASADVLLNTSKAEGLGLPLLEAMSIGGAIPIATRTSAIPELIEEGTGLLIESGYDFWDVYGDTRRSFPSIEDGANKLQILYEASEDFRDHMREFGRAYARSRPWDYTINIFYDIINLNRPGLVMDRKILS
jgi:glycosyltransferase involved in cell wall biosynthesis